MHNVRDLPYTYNRETTIIQMVNGDYCPVCGEIVSDMNESESVINNMNAFRNQVNKGLTK